MGASFTQKYSIPSSAPPMNRMAKPTNNCVGISFFMPLHIILCRILAQRGFRCGADRNSSRCGERSAWFILSQVADLFACSELALSAAKGAGSEGQRYGGRNEDPYF